MDYYLGILREMDWTYYIPVGIATIVGIYGVVWLKRCPLPIRLLFVLVCPTFGLAGAMAAYIHTGPRAFGLFGVAVLCALVGGAIEWRYLPNDKAAKKT